VALSGVSAQNVQMPVWTQVEKPAQAMMEKVEAWAMM